MYTLDYDISTVEKPAVCAGTPRSHEEHERPSRDKETPQHRSLSHLLVRRGSSLVFVGTLFATVCDVSRDWRLLIIVFTHQRPSLLERSNAVWG